MAFEINSEEESELGDVPQEGQQVIMRAVGKPPSQKELDEHMLTHIPYRNWCKHCISGRGQNDDHKHQLEGREQEIPTLS